MPKFQNPQPENIPQPSADIDSPAFREAFVRQRLDRLRKEIGYVLLTMVEIEEFMDR